MNSGSCSLRKYGKQSLQSEFYSFDRSPYKAIRQKYDGCITRRNKQIARTLKAKLIVDLNNDQLPRNQHHSFKVLHQIFRMPSRDLHQISVSMNTGSDL